VHLLFFIRVAEDDDLAITGWPKDVVVDVTKKPSGERLIPRDIAMRSPSSEDEERSTTGAFPEDPPCSHASE
jgi:hypothetical protein